MSTSRSTDLARSLRRAETPQERRLWAALRGARLNGLKFRRQCPLFGYIVDFYCSERGLVVELDGAPHLEAEQQAYDQFRDQLLREKGLAVLRFANHEIDRALPAVLARIAEAADAARLVDQSADDSF